MKRGSLFVALCILISSVNFVPANASYVAVIHYLRLPQSTGAATDYDSWVSGQDDVPSMGTLRNRLGAWNQIRNDAIERMQNGE
jgi:hypothetical protein